MLLLQVMLRQLVELRMKRGSGFHIPVRWKIGQSWLGLRGRWLLLILTLTWISMKAIEYEAVIGLYADCRLIIVVVIVEEVIVVVAVRVV